MRGDMGRDTRPLRIQQREVSTLAGTAKPFRILETVCTYSFPLWWLTLLARTWSGFRGPAFVVLATIVGILLSDFITGMFHWGFDTWFSPTTPFIGRAFVRTFREHHIDPQAICRHDFVETNGSNMFSGIILILTGHACMGSSAGAAFLATSYLSAAVFMSMTSQIHKWAHADHVPRVVTWLQWTRLILPPQSHALHHVAPFDRSYCISSGWLNATLRYVRFFQILERIISALTGVLPRHDDIGVEAAAALVEVEERSAPERQGNGAT